MMGILSGITKALDYISAPLSQPITFITSGPTAAAQKVAQTRQEIREGKASGGKVIATTLATTGIVGAGVLASAGASAGAIGSTARSLALTTPVKTVALGTAALAVAAPKTLQVITSKPEAVKVAVATAINPALGIVAGIEQGSNLIKEAVVGNEGTLKTIGGVLGATLLTGAGVVAGSQIKDYLSDDEAPTLSQETPVEQKQDIISQTPMTPETTTISTTDGLTTRRKRRKAKPVTQNISQRVNVIVDNRTSKKYINGVCI